MEMRVVAEAAVAARRIDDRAVPRAFGDHRLGIVGVPDQHQHAIVMRAPVGDARKRRDELLVVARIGRRARPRSAPSARRARRPSACDAHARIVGERGQLRMQRSRAAPWRARSRRRWRAAPPLRGCRARPAAITSMPSGASSAREFAQLAGVAATPAPAVRSLRRLRARRSAPRPARAMPRSASASSASISARENGAPSAVPCTSTNPPPAVITTFMSVSQAESSA